MIVLAQAMAEYGLLNALISGVSTARYRIELYIGAGNTKYLLCAAFVLLVVFLFRRK